MGIQAHRNKITGREIVKYGGTLKNKKAYEFNDSQAFLWQGY